MKKKEDATMDIADPVSVAPVADAAEKEKEGIYVYIGPTIRGVIVNGSVQKGTKSDIMSQLGDNAEKYPQIRKLLIADTELAKARQKLSSGEGAISVVCRELEKKIREGK